ncbi:hypothetical protein TB2_003449 [Malus domestica]
MDGSEGNKLSIGFPTKSVRYDICVTMMILNSAIVVTNEFHPPSLYQVQLLLGENIFQALVIRKDAALLAVKVMSPNFQSKDYCSKFQIMSGVIFLIRFEFPGSIGSDFSMLHQNTT